MNIENDSNEKIEKEHERTEIFTPYLNIPLCSMKLFKQLQRDRVYTEEQLNDAYVHYENKFKEKKIDEFFTQNKDTKWFNDLFNIKVIKEICKERVQDRKRSYENFVNQIKCQKRDMDNEVENIDRINSFSPQHIKDPLLAEHCENVDYGDCDEINNASLNEHKIKEKIKKYFQTQLFCNNFLIFSCNQDLSLLEIYQIILQNFKNSYIKIIVEPIFQLERKFYIMFDFFENLNSTFENIRDGEIFGLQEVSLKCDLIFLDYDSYLINKDKLQECYQILIEREQEHFENFKSFKSSLALNDENNFFENEFCKFSILIIYIQKVYDFIWSRNIEELIQDFIQNNVNTLF
jgi:hypothetical protein